VAEVGVVLEEVAVVDDEAGGEGVALVALYREVINETVVVNEGKRVAPGTRESPRWSSATTYRISVRPSK
jgi:hypothetical protein